uniref:Uncharacterized protein n=1 Tax=Anguilla anguilla TaxID=7936 RepID=A0A0E9U5A8_ANGAN
MTWPLSFFILLHYPQPFLKKSPAAFSVQIKSNRAERVRIQVFFCDIRGYLRPQQL